MKCGNTPGIMIWNKVGAGCAQVLPFTWDNVPVFDFTIDGLYALNIGVFLNMVTAPETLVYYNTIAPAVVMGSKYTSAASYLSVLLALLLALLALIL